MSIKDDSNEILTTDTINNFLVNRTGPMTSTGLSQVTGFMESSYAIPGIPDIQVFFDDSCSNCVDKSSQTYCQNNGSRYSDRREVVFRPVVLQTRSHGYLTLRSKNPMDHPLIYPNYLTEKTDMKILIQGIRKISEIAKTDTMKKLDMKIEKESHPQCSR